MNGDLIALGILLIAVVAVAVRNEHRITKLEGFNEGTKGVEHYLEKRLDKHEARLDRLDEG
jgi:hypothetical protein